MRYSFLSVTFYAFIMSASLNAQTSQIISIFKDINENEPIPSNDLLISEIMKSALVIYKNKGDCVPKSATIETASPATAVRFVANGYIARQIKNAWTVVVRHPNCGADIIRYAVVRQSDGGLYAFRINRGQSNANDSLIGDTLPSAIALSLLTLKRAKIDCDNKDIKDFTLGVTQIVKESADLGPETYGVRYKGTWQEVWPIMLCGRTVEVGIDFNADGDGGAYTGIKDENVKLLPKRN